MIGALHVLARLGADLYPVTYVNECRYDDSETSLDNRWLAGTRGCLTFHHGFGFGYRQGYALGKFNTNRLVVVEIYLDLFIWEKIL